MTFGGGRGGGTRRASAAFTGGATSGRMLGRGGADFDRVPPERRGRTLRRIVAFFRPYRGRVAIVVVAILATSLLGLINPILLKLLIDDALPSRDFGRLNLYVGLMIAIPIFTGLIGIGQSYLNNLIGQRVMQDLRSALYAHLQRMPLRFFTETKTGEIQSRLANDVGGVQGVVTDTASSVASNIAIALGTIIAMILIDWRLTALSLGLLPFFMYLTYRVGKVRREVSTETQEALAELASTTQETLSVSGMLLTKTFGQQEAANERFSGLNRRLAALQIRQAMVGRWFFMIVGTVFSITPAFVYWLAGFLAINGDSSAPTIGDIVAFTTLQSRLFFPLGQLLNVQVEMQGALALFDRIFEYLELDPVIVDAPDAVDLAARPVAGRIRFRDVSFTYPSPPPVEASATADSTGSTDALDSPMAPASGFAAAPEPLPFGLSDIDFEAEPGQLVALVGPSGSGKTTTTYLIPRLYDADRGAVEIDGTDVRQISLVSLGRVIGFVTQETYLFHATVRENLLYAKPEATQPELEVAARAAAIHDRVMELPQGYDTIVGERGYKLSGGEKQRIAIARVLLKDPRILILDEATSALDTVSERLIQAALERLEKGRTTIAIAHRLSTILRAEQILVYEAGRIVERGTHAQLLARGGLYSRLYREQFQDDGAAARSRTGSNTTPAAATGPDTSPLSPSNGAEVPNGAGVPTGPRVETAS
ncbi:MAG TPA: ABC transporter ATP-binding protein [Candidatus Limnocylindrales bacterium]|nr:ABC transporter ATP-binding protein [Candidatus Limnocylindrales bacterium]